MKEQLWIGVNEMFVKPNSMHLDLLTCKKLKFDLVKPNVANACYPLYSYKCYINLNTKPNITVNIPFNNSLPSDLVTAAVSPIGDLFLNPIMWKYNRIETGNAISIFDNKSSFLLKYSDCADRLQNLIEEKLYPTLNYTGTSNLGTFSIKSAEINDTIFDEISSEIMILNNLLNIQTDSIANICNDLIVKSNLYFENLTLESEDNLILNDYIEYMIPFREKSAKRNLSLDDDGQESSSDSESDSELENVSDDLLLTKVCSVCLEKQNASYNPILFCTSCCIGIHVECYYGGAHNIKIEEIKSSWKCDRCELGLHLEPCFVCNRTQGFMKLAKDGIHWCHIVCIFLNQYLQFEKYTHLEDVIGFETIPKDFSKLACYFCNKKGSVCIQCKHPRCSTSFHASCAVEAGYEMSDRIDGRFGIYCNKHRDDQNSDLINRYCSILSDKLNGTANATRKLKFFDNSTHSRNSKTIRQANTSNIVKRETHENYLNTLLLEYPLISAFDSSDLDLCDVCFSESTEDGNVLVFCDRCNIAVHQICYGIDSLPVNDWYCSRCSKSISIEECCAVCPLSIGSMKEIKASSDSLVSDYSLVHAVCVQYIPQLYFDPNDYVCGFDLIPASKWKLTCQICNVKRGICITCSHPSCNATFHASCARYYGYELSTAYIKGNFSYLAYCYFHRKNKISFEEAAFLYKTHNQLLNFNSTKNLTSSNFESKVETKNKINISSPSLSMFKGICDVCLLESSEPENLKCVCISCKITVHINCYETKFSNIWKCDACVSTLTPKCALCPYLGGAMKRTKEDTNVWVHILCALNHPETYLENGCPVNYLAALKSKRASIPCCICNFQEGVTTQCAFSLYKGCAKYIHITCAREKGIPVIDLDRKDAVFFSYCIEHVDFGRKKLMGRYQPCNIKSAPNLLLLPEVEVKSMFNTQFKLNSLSAENLPSCVRILGCKFKFEHDCPKSDDQISKKFKPTNVSINLGNIKSLVNQLSPKKSTNISTIEILNNVETEDEDEESNSKLYCICRSSSLSKDGEMVGCDGCDEWFHFDCLGFKPESIADFESWFCKKCLQSGRSTKNSKNKRPAKLKSDKAAGDLKNAVRQSSLDGFIKRRSPRKQN